MTILKLSATLVLFFNLTAFAGASEPAEIRERAEAMRREAAELAERGHQEEAANLQRQAMAMMQQAERLEHDRPDPREAKVLEMTRRLEKLRREEMELKASGGKQERLEDIRRQAERVERELHELSHRPPRHDAPVHEDIARRMEHMRLAVEHLHHAGLHDIAEHVAQRAEATERELHKQQRHHEDNGVHQVMKQLDELRHELGRLRDEVNQLKEKR